MRGGAWIDYIAWNIKMTPEVLKKILSPKGMKTMWPSCDYFTKKLSNFPFSTHGFRWTKTQNLSNWCPPHLVQRYKLYLHGYFKLIPLSDPNFTYPSTCMNFLSWFYFLTPMDYYSPPWGEIWTFPWKKFGCFWK